MSMSLFSHSERISLAGSRTLHHTARSAHRVREQVHQLYPRMYSRAKVNNAITYACVGTGMAVYAAWNYAQGGLLYNVWTSIRGKKDGWLRKLGLDLPPQRSVERILTKYFLLTTSDPDRRAAWIGSAFSHQNFIHMIFNLMTWTSAAPLLFALPPAHTLVLIFGSAVASSASWLAAEKSKGSRETRTRSALGSSGIVSGVLSTAALFFPKYQVRVFGVVPMPLFVAVGGFFLADAYMSQSDIASPIGHAAHLGGSAFGIAYYVLVLRRYGGILGR